MNNVIDRNTPPYPSLDDLQLSEERQARLAAMLEEQWKFRVEQVTQLDNADIGRFGTPAAQAVNRRILLAAWTVLADMRAARERLADGTYGWCVRCTDPLPYERLEAMPHAALCEPCLRSAQS
jgi:DnaK suppressor protein